MSFINNLSVTAIILTKDRPDYLKQSFNSVLNQTILPEQIIIIDDASALEYDWEAYKVRFHNLVIKRFDEVKGANYCRNHGVSAAKSKIVAFLDDDDAWKINYLHTAIEQYKTNNKIVGTTCGKEIMDSDGRLVINSKPFVVEEELKKGNTYCGMSGVTVLKDVALTIPFDNDLPNGQDWDFFVRVVQAGLSLKNIPIALYDYRIGTDGGITQRLKKMRPEAAENRLLSAAKHRAWLGERAYRTRVIIQLLRGLKTRQYKGGWVKLAVKHAGLFATLQFLLFRKT